MLKIILIFRQQQLWFEQFQDPTISHTVMDRILHRFYELKIKGRLDREKIYANKDKD